MTIGSAIYKLLIGPLELLFEVVFAIASRVVHHPGLAIIFLSLAMNFLVLPLYKRADAVQAEERDLEASLEPWASRIKKTFSGDERFMMLQTYYRQRNYKPSYALKGSLSLLLEIPFFIAAYRFLSGLQLLHGISFGPIRDLGAPDALLTVAGVSINILPILMTAINAVSAAIYMKGFPLKSKLQMYGMALVFLVLLYTSPAGLVFYWTLNNIFSLFKNIFYKLKNPGKVLRICASVAGLLLLVHFMLNPFPEKRRQMIVLIAVFLLQLPAAISIIKERRADLTRGISSSGPDNRLFTICCVFLTLLTGILIPSAVINTSPTEFVNISAARSPLWYILSALLMATGTFMIWFGIFYRLANGSTKKLLGLGIWIIAGIAVIDYMFFGTKYGDISPTLVYDNFPTNSTKDYLLNALAILALAAVFFLIWKKKPVLARVVGLTLCLAVLVMSVMNVTSIQKEMKVLKADIEEANKDMPEFPISKDGKNVVIFMLDKGVGYYIPYIMAEDPTLKQQFDGFTYYSQTVTYGTSTNAGTPALFGGYEYRPAEINKRTEDKLKVKQNEALRLMPVLFDEAGYAVTVMDPPYAGYKGFPMDLSIYDDHPNIHAYISRGKFSLESASDAATEASRHRNFFCYSVYKISPLLIQPTLYARGLYNEADAQASLGGVSAESTQTLNGFNKATGITSRFLESYAVLKNLPNMTRFQDSGNTFLSLSNEQTHESILTQMPNYTPSLIVDNSAYEKETPERYDEDGNLLEFTEPRQLATYHTDMVALKELGAWFDYLRENDAYDNTRIIIVSDHGIHLYHPGLQFNDKKWGDVTAYTCFLLEKDFNSTGFHVDDTFMTNADVPLMAFDSLIENPVNPATGNPVTDDAKYEGSPEIQAVIVWDIAKNHGNVFEPAHWVTVEGDIYDPNNWRYLGDY